MPHAFHATPDHRVYSTAELTEVRRNTLRFCTLITAWTRAKFSSPSCLVVAVAVLQRGLAGGPHRFEFGIAALAKRVRPPQLAASFMSANGNSAFIRTINSPEAHSTSHQTPAAQRRLEQRSVPGLLVARNHSPYSLSNVSKLQKLARRSTT